MTKLIALQIEAEGPECDLKQAVRNKGENMSGWHHQLVWKRTATRYRYIATGLSWIASGWRWRRGLVNVVIDDQVILRLASHQM